MQDQALLDPLTRWLDGGQQVALATVTKTWGSAPRREGSKLAVTPDLALTGSVSGGCVEGAVIEEALISLQSASAKLLSFGVADRTAWDVGLTCGGEIDIFVEALDMAWWQIVRQRLMANQRSSTATVLSGALIGQKVLCDADGQVLYASDGLGADAVRELQVLAASTSSPRERQWGEQRVFVDVSDAPPHLIIIGGVHVAIPLERIARTMGFRVSLIDPRRAFATRERFPDVEMISHDYPAQALAQLDLNADTYLAVLTHDPKIDDQALVTALPLHLPYIGVLSSRRTHQQRVKRLQAAGLSDDLIEQIYTPIGLALGGRTPEDIALGIMAEIVAVRHAVRERFPQ